MTASLALLCLLALPAGPAFASDLSADFEILRKGAPIGIHSVKVTETGDQTQVETRIAMRVKFGPVTLFRYSHEANEIWRDGRLERLTSATIDGGKRRKLEVVRVGDEYRIEGDGGVRAAPGDAIPSSYWNKDIVKTSRLLNTQTGEIIEVTVADLGVQPAPGGGAADQHRVTGSVDLDLWYDGEKWVGADFTIRDERLTYRPVDERSRDQLLAKLDIADDQSATR